MWRRYYRRQRARRGAAGGHRETAIRRREQKRLRAGRPAMRGGSAGRGRAGWGWAVVLMRDGRHGWECNRERERAAGGRCERRGRRDDWRSLIRRYGVPAILELFSAVRPPLLSRLHPRSSACTHSNDANPARRPPRRLPPSVATIVVSVTVAPTRDPRARCLPPRCPHCARSPVYVFSRAQHCAWPAFSLPVPSPPRR